MKFVSYCFVSDWNNLIQFNSILERVELVTENSRDKRIRRRIALRSYIARVVIEESDQNTRVRILTIR